MEMTLVLFESTFVMLEKGPKPARFGSVFGLFEDWSSF